MNRLTLIAIITALGDLIADIRLEWVDPVAGAAKLPPTDMQPLPPDASELARRYHEIYAARVRDWWLSLRTGS